MNRRGLLGAILAAATAPAFVRAGSLMVPATARQSLDHLGEAMLSGASLQIGSLFTIAGVTGRFRVTEVASSGVVGVALA